MIAISFLVRSEAILARLRNKKRPDIAPGPTLPCSLYLQVLHHVQAKFVGGLLDERPRHRRAYAI